MHRAFAEGVFTEEKAHVRSGGDKEKQRPENTGYFPMFVDLWQKPVLVAGAGKIAGRRIHTLQQFGACITVAAPEISDEIQKLSHSCQEAQITLLCRSYEAKDCEGMYLVLAATDDSKLNAEICRQAKAAGALVNNASDRSQCDFYFPGIIKEECTVIGFNAGGNDHRWARKLRQKVETFLVHEGILKKERKP